MFPILGIIPNFALMIIYIQTIDLNTKRKIPYRIVIDRLESSEEQIILNFRPSVSIPKKIIELHNLDRMQILAAEPFCDIADELIAQFQNSQLIFSEYEQFRLLKSQFKAIGYNFNLKPKFIWSKEKTSYKNLANLKKEINTRFDENSLEFAKLFIASMSITIVQKDLDLKEYKTSIDKAHDHNLSLYKKTAGVYFFLNENDEVLYVGKAKNVRKRLQSHFSSQANQSNIDYSLVKNIDVIYTGNDIIAQLIETKKIKKLKPVYNTQQIEDPAPYIINRGVTAKGIYKLQITRKEIEDNLPEKYFNRASVLKSLHDFCISNKLCRKHCGLESVKGPCSNYTLSFCGCVCSGAESIENYNERFEKAFDIFQKVRVRKIYKLKGRNSTEDSFVYMVNDIYEGYGYISKDEQILNENDLLGYLVIQSNNYDTSRILDNIDKLTDPKNILWLVN